MGERMMGLNLWITGHKMMGLDLWIEGPREMGYMVVCLVAVRVISLSCFLNVLSGRCDMGRQLNVKMTLQIQLSGRMFGLVSYTNCGTKEQRIRRMWGRVKI